MYSSRSLQVAVASAQARDEGISMLKHLALMSLAVASLSSVAWAQSGGTYQETCENIRRRGPFLVAECETRYGDTRTSSLDVRGCRGDIANSNGRLTCSRTGARYQDGYGYGRYRPYADDRPDGGYRSWRGFGED